MGKTGKCANFKICKECGKRFYLYSGVTWSWKLCYEGHKYNFCSYTCKRKFEKKMLEQTKE